ncbi:MAG: aconitase X catalytic domain-containing protein [Thermoplasmata archaeon]
MHLTKDQERLLKDGEYGERKSMEILCALGDVFGADRLIPVSSAHVSGVSYKTIGDAGIDFLEQMSKGTKVKVRTTANPIAMDRKRWREMEIPDDFARKQMHIVEIYRQIGVEESWTCTPYLAGNRPSSGEAIAWAESSAIIFANSVLGARTNREGGPSALASAMTGLTPRYGLHIDDNRRATIIVDVPSELGEKDFASLGCLVGELSKDGIPYFRGLTANESSLKSLGAAMASTGSIALFHVENITPEYSTALADKTERIEIDREDLEEKADDLGTDDEPDLIAIGCPHLSRLELEALSRIKERKRRGTETWLCTSREVFNHSQDLIGELEGIGKILCDTCMVVCPIEERSRTVATNSGKAAFYLPKFCSQKVVFDDAANLMRRFL